MHFNLNYMQYNYLTYFHKECGSGVQTLSSHIGDVKTSQEGAPANVHLTKKPETVGNSKSNIIF